MADISRNFKSPPRGAKVVDVAASRTLKPSESGQTFYANAATSLSFQLPLIRKPLDGVTYTITVGQLPGSGAGHELRPNAADQLLFAAAGAASTAGQAMLNAVAGDQIGATVTVQAAYGVGWVVKSVFGTWTKVA